MRVQRRPRWSPPGGGEGLGGFGLGASGTVAQALVLFARRVGDPGDWCRIKRTGREFPASKNILLRVNGANSIPTFVPYSWHFSAAGGAEK